MKQYMYTVMPVCRVELDTKSTFRLAIYVDTCTSPHLYSMEHEVRCVCSSVISDGGSYPSTSSSLKSKNSASYTDRITCSIGIHIQFGGQCANLLEATVFCCGHVVANRCILEANCTLIGLLSGRWGGGG